MAQARTREIQLIIIPNINSKRLFNTPYNYIYLLDKTIRNEKIAATIKLKLILYRLMLVSLKTFLENN